MADLNWPELGAVNLDTGFNADWTRKQVSLTSYTNRTVRLRFQVWSYYGSAPDEDLFLDKIADCRRCRRRWCWKRSRRI